MLQTTSACRHCRVVVLQMTVFFSKAKTAVIIGLVILFGSVFPDIAVEGGSVSSAAKVSLPSVFRGLQLVELGRGGNGISVTVTASLCNWLGLA